MKIGGATSTHWRPRNWHLQVAYWSWVTCYGDKLFEMVFGKWMSREMLAKLEKLIFKRVIRSKKRVSLAVEKLNTNVSKNVIAK